MNILKNKLKSFFSMLVMVVALAAFSNCANTARGVERDTDRNIDKAGDAVEDAGDELEEVGDEIERETDN
ncbi:MAG: hypothetical protein M3421_06555 [Bacteroidota bacterium]|nr:hypothetical protein [Bacteroidota bacterium]